MVEITAETDIRRIMITVQSKGSPPAYIDPACGPVYEYEDVNIYYAGESCLSCGKIDFRVEKSWLSAKGYDSNDIVMMHYNGDTFVWEELSTTFTGEDGACYCYSAQTPSFSLFAIAVLEDGTIVKEEEVKSTPAEMQVPEEKPVYTAAQTPSAIKAGTASPEKEKPMIPVIIPVIFTLVALFFLIRYANRMRIKKYPDWWWDTGMK